MKLRSHSYPRRDPGCIYYQGCFPGIEGTRFFTSRVHLRGRDPGRIDREVLSRDLSIESKQNSEGSVPGILASIK